MKNMVLGLALCLGLSQVAVAAKKDISFSEKEVKGAVTWIKANPKKAALIATSIAAAAGLTAYAGYNIATSNEGGVWGKTKDGLATTGYNVFVNPFVFAKDKAFDAAGWTKDKAIAGKDLAYEYRKGLGISSAVVVAVIAAALIADYATTDKEAEMRIQKAWKKLIEKKVAKPAIA